MKRCPQCLFLYPDSDERCDFDKTPLEIVDDVEVDAATSSTRATRPARRVLPIVAAVALMFAVLTFALYYGFSHRREATVSSQSSTAVEPLAASQAVVTTPSPSPVGSPSPSPSPSASPSPKAS